MRNAYTVFGVVCAALLFGLALTGCHEGPAEKAGRKVDRAVEKTGDAIRDAGMLVTSGDRFIRILPPATIEPRLLRESCEKIVSACTETAARLTA